MDVRPRKLKLHRRCFMSDPIHWSTEPKQQKMSHWSSTYRCQMYAVAYLRTDSSIYSEIALDYSMCADVKALYIIVTANWHL